MGGGDDLSLAKLEVNVSCYNHDSGAGLMSGGTADHSVNSLEVSTAQDQAKGWNNPKKEGDATVSKKKQAQLNAQGSL